MMLFVVYGVGVAVLRCLLDRFYFVSGTVCALFVYLFLRCLLGSLCVVFEPVLCVVCETICALFLGQFVRCL